MTTDWQQQLQDTLQNATAPTRGPAPVSADQALVAELRAAAERFAKRRDSFAEGKPATCLDIAAKVERFGSFASDKQREFALKLVTWSKPREGAAAPVAPAAPALAPSPQLFKVMQKHAKFYAGNLTLSRRNADTLVWVKWHDQVVGVIEGGSVKLHERKLGAADKTAVTAMLAEFEADPLGAAQKYGRLSGICCSCGADLTNEDSIAAGIGPICRQRFA